MARAARSAKDDERYFRKWVRSNPVTAGALGAEWALAEITRLRRLLAARKRQRSTSGYGIHRPTGRTH